MGGMEETLLIQVLLELRDTRFLWWSYSPRTNPSAGPWGGASPPRPNLIETVRLRWGLSCQTSPLSRESVSMHVLACIKVPLVKG